MEKHTFFIIVVLCIFSSNTAFAGENFEALPNAKQLNTTTYDGSGQAVHPDIYFNPNGWNGYKYWMTMTPYPGGNSVYENPSVLVSNDGISWNVPTGLTNPIDQQPPEGSNSDVEIVYNGNQLEIYYVESGGGTSFLRRRVSKDGVQWSGEQSIFDLPDYQIMSPAIVKVGSEYNMWYTGGANCNSDIAIKLKKSTDGVNWSSAQSVNINHDVNVWHVDVQYVNGKYWMLYSAYPKGSNCGNTDLYFATSSDKTNWITEGKTPIMNRTSFYSAQIYRTTFFVSVDKINVWISGRTSNNIWHIGYTSANLISKSYMPPTPTISAVAGSDYVLTTWIDGIGNRTDKFNVFFNGVWNNGTTNHSVNQTDMSRGQSSEVIVYALNGTIMNATPAALVSTIPIPVKYVPPIPVISATMGADWIMTRWTAGAGNMTDKFNVLLNGVWTNGTTNLSINMTNLSAGNYTDVKVYAVNGSIVNPTPASLNTTLAAPTQMPASVYSGGGGSSGGGGGGSFYDPNAYKFERQDTTIHKDVLSKVQFKKNGLVDEISFYGIKTYGDVTSVVSLLLNNPTTIPLDGVKTYFSVSLGSIKGEEEPLYIKSASITLTLDPSDITNKKVMFYRFVNGSWELLESTEVASNKDTLSGHFKLSMPGFSNFAVVIQDVVPESAAPAKVMAAVELAEDTNMRTNPDVQKSSVFNVAGIGIVSVLSILSILSILYLRKKL